MRIRSNNERGAVLATVLVISGLLGIVLVAYLTFVGNQNKFTMRSASWNSALVLAESGVEEALTHLNYSGTGANWETHGWTFTGGVYKKTRSLESGYFAATISTSSPPIIQATGYVLAPLQTNYISRTVQVVTTNASMKGLVALGSVTMSGGSVVDSFDSSDPLYSTGGKYDPAKATDDAYVGVVVGTPSNIRTGTGRIFGRAASGPGGSVLVDSSGGLGTTAWVTAHPGTVQSGYFTTDLNLSTPVVSVPFAGGFSVPAPGTVNGTNFDLLLDTGNYQNSGVNLGGGQKMIVTGKAVFYVTGDFALSGDSYVLIVPGATLQLYVGGSKLNLSGGGVLNGAGDVSALTVYALPSVTQFEYSGSATFLGSIIAPSADLNISGAGGVAGAAFVKTASLSGGAGFHCDQALNKAHAKYTVIAWDEI